MPDTASSRPPLRSLATRWLPRRTVRLRLTLLYGGLFLLAGALLLAITYALVAGQAQIAQSTVSVHQSGVTNSQPLEIVGAANALNRAGLGAQGVIVHASSGGVAVPSPNPAQLRVLARALSGSHVPTGQAAVIATQLSTAGAEIVSAQLNTQRSGELALLLTGCGIALAIMALVSVGLGWLMAGRVLAPLRTMTTRAQRISAHNLHERLALEGHDDELRDLADTFDGLLGRLERAFEAQRRFVANASHELRTPLTLERAMVEVALADPDLDVASLRAVCERVIASGEEQERLIEALLTLARSERGIEQRDTFDLADVTGEALQALRARSTKRLPRIELSLSAAPISGDRALIERLVVNLLDNAVRHNVRGGWVRVSVSRHESRSRLRVINSGRPLTPQDISALIEPFRRAAADRSGRHQGHGLGLSIAQAIADAHDAQARIDPGPEGGLDIEVEFAADLPLPERPDTTTPTTSLPPKRRGRRPPDARPM
jgi:signal transduction histidine kinase